MPATPCSYFPSSNPNLNTSDWRPRFIHFLYLALTNSTAFSPTDVMPLAPWAKIAMAVQSLVSLAILGLVAARAVNAFAQSRTGLLFVREQAEPPRSRRCQIPWGFSSRTPWAASAPALVGLPLRMYSKPTAIIAPMIGPTR